MSEGMPCFELRGRAPRCLFVFSFTGNKEEVCVEGNSEGQILRACNIQAQVYVYMCVIRNTQMIVKLHV